MFKRRTQIQSRDRTHANSLSGLHSFLIDHTAYTATIMRDDYHVEYTAFGFSLLSLSLSRRENNTTLPAYLSSTRFSGAICSAISSGRSNFNLRPVSQEIWLLGRKRKRRRPLPPPLHPFLQFALPFGAPLISLNLLPYFVAVNPLRAHDQNQINLRNPHGETSEHQDALHREIQY